MGKIKKILTEGGHMIVKGTGKAIGAALSVPSKVKGAIADNKRGHALYNQGYGDYYESARSIANKGKADGKKRVGSTAVYLKKDANK